MSRFVKFNAVGAIGVALQLAAVWLFVDAAGWPVALGTAAAVVLTVLHNFVWHVRWTWADRAPRGRARAAALARFALANGAISFAGNVAITTALTAATPIPASAANAVAIVACGVLNYAAAACAVFPPTARRAG